MNPYIEKLAELRAGTLEDLLVAQLEFLTFREAWLKAEDRNDFVGEAGLNGNIRYRYIPVEDSEKNEKKTEKNR